MKEFINKNKPLIIILGSAVFLILIIIVPLVLFGEKNQKEKDKNFPNYEEIKINDKTFEKEENKVNIEDTLRKDTRFQRTMMIDDYDSSSVSKKDLEKMVENYVFTFEMSNTKYLALHDRNKGVSCMKEEYFVESFKELYNTDVTKYLKDMTYYYKFLYKKKNYCFYYYASGKWSRYNINLQFNSLNYNDDILTADIGTYVYYIPMPPSPKEKTAEQFNSLFESKKYTEAKRLLIDELEGEYKRKLIKFKINNDGKFFKYQIISIKTIDN